MKAFLNTFFPFKINKYFFIGTLLLFFVLNYIGVSFFNDIETKDVKHSRGIRGNYFYHHK